MRLIQYEKEGNLTTVESKKEMSKLSHLLLVH